MFVSLNSASVSKSSKQTRVLDARTRRWAKRKGHLELLQWAVERGAPLDYSIDNYWEGGECDEGVVGSWQS